MICDKCNGTGEITHPEGGPQFECSDCDPRWGRPTKGGPTVTDPDRPYCKPDQSCCDFCCGN